MLTKDHTAPAPISALEAKNKALELAFAPFSFQVTYALLKLGILECIGHYADEGVCAEDIARQTGVSIYGVNVLLELALFIQLVWLNDGKYVLDKTGHFVLTDSMVQVNMDFTQDVCYQGLFHLLEAIKSGKPEGLKVFGDWPTIYPALSLLPDKAKKSWFEFDHYYSDKAFLEVLPIVFAQPVKRLLDVGGNTGKWTLQCLRYDDEVTVSIADLPQQLAVAQQSIHEQGFQHRFHGHAMDLLQKDAQLPVGHDVIWMSQFLDCFSENEILTILRRAVAVMDKNSRLYILELFWDRQKFPASAFAINCTSIYFTALANGNSRMYRSKDLLTLIHQAGLYVDEDIDNIGAGHTLLGCKRRF